MAALIIISILFVYLNCLAPLENGRYVKCCFDVFLELGKGLFVDNGASKPNGIAWFCFNADRLELHFT